MRGIWPLGPVLTGVGASDPTFSGGCHRLGQRCGPFFTKLADYCPFPERECPLRSVNHKESCTDQAVPVEYDAERLRE